MLSSILLRSRTDTSFDINYMIELDALPIRVPVSFDLI
jgi:hypothetical protein